MEKELNIPTQLFGGPPERDNIIKMAESQIGFMNISRGRCSKGLPTFCLVCASPSTKLP